ncbi:MAG: redoxin domain-containing protein [Candidatus Eisenbacteria bacterium]
MKSLLPLLLTLVTAGIVLADEAPPLQVGSTAPGFTLPYATRDSIARDSLSLSALVGKRNIVLAFYPADWSGGCTMEVCTLRDNFTALGALNADVIGISGDYIFSHYEWAKHHNLPFRLASDHKHLVAKEYGSYLESVGYNRRTGFVIDKQGKVAYMDMTYSPRDSVSFGKLQTALRGMR